MKLKAVILLAGIGLLLYGGYQSWLYFNQYRPPSLPQPVTTSWVETAAPTSSAPTTSSAAVTSTTVAPATVTTETAAYGRPTHLTISQIGVDDPLVSTPLGPAGEFEAEPFTVAWYDGSVWPGQPGPMLLGAHVAWKDKGPDRFARLTELRPGDEFSLQNELGERFFYRVTDSYSVDKEAEFSAFIKDTVYGETNEHVLWLNTCGGDLRPTGSFADNIFVRAVLVPEEG